MKSVTGITGFPRMANIVISRVSLPNDLSTVWHVPGYRQWMSGRAGGSVLGTARCWEGSGFSGFACGRSAPSLMPRLLRMNSSHVIFFFTCEPATFLR